MSFPDFKAVTFNCKGLTNPIRAKAIHSWLSDLKANLDFICINEIKVSGFQLSSNLKIIDRSLFWITSSHHSGKGGVCLGLKDSLAKTITNSVIHNSWVGVTLGPPYNLTLAAVYAPNSSNERKQVWDELSSINGPTILLGDFNMVTSIEDRWNGIGTCLSGQEKVSWDYLADHLDIIDMTTSTNMTWANHQSGSNYRSARLDRFYCTPDIFSNYVSIEAQVLHSISISDHKPVLLECSHHTSFTRSGWFHADQSLFKFEAVKNCIESIFDKAFHDYPSPAKAWHCAVKDTQICLREFKQKMTNIRTRKRRDLTQRIQQLSSSTLPPTEEILILQKDLKLEELLEAQKALVFTREFWAGKIDKPNKNMFHLLKQKQARDKVPNLIDHQGNLCSNEGENLDCAFNFFNNIFGSTPLHSPDKTNARAKIALTRKKTVTDAMKVKLDAHVTLDEIKDSILTLANGKSPGIDGLPNEFFKTYVSFLAPNLLLVWKESVRYGALPTCINTGVVKLIHKRGEKNKLDNWRPITCMTSIYKTFALCLSRRLSPMMDAIILSSQKGFIKGRYILDAILNLWEGSEYASDLSLDFLFLKIDFDKAYDRVEWDFILQSLYDMGCGKMFIKFVHVLLGNATTHISLNGKLT